MGRDDELHAIEALCTATPTAPTALVLEGEPGIGKSTLWRRGVELAEEHGIRTLTSRPAEAERTHGYAALGDLLEGVVDEVASELPVPRRHALRVALLLEAPEGAASARAVGVATRSTLELLAARGPLAVAIDDEQWLDASSAEALVFALRRLAAPVRLFLSRRAGAADPLEGALPEDAVQSMTVGGLSLGATHQLLHERLGASFSRVLLRRLHETAGGNPFYALELAQALGSRTAIDPTQPLPVPGRLEELLEARLEGLAGPTHEALVLVSAHPRLTAAQLEAAGVAREALEPALQEYVLEAVEGGIRFTHPLLASALYQGLSSAERRRVHANLAELVEDPVDRARHLALATESPDPGVAALLERAASTAEARGAPAVAAELGEHALRLTPPEADEDADRRLGAAVRAHLDAGEAERGRALARELLARTPSGPRRAEALLLTAIVEQEDLPRRIPLLREALPEAAGQPALEVTIRRHLGASLRFIEGNAAAEEHARAAVELAEGLGDDGAAAAALAALAVIRFNRGGSEARGLAEQGLELAGTVDRGARREAALGLVHILVWSRDNERARDLLAAVQEEWGDRAEHVTAIASWYRALVELHSGRLALAAELAEQSRELSVQYSREGAESPQSLFAMALVAAYGGELERARALAEHSLRLSEGHGSLLAGPLAALGLVELWAGDVARAVERFAAADGTAATADQNEPGVRWWCGEHVEGLLELQRIDDAVALLDQWEADARRLDRGWVLTEAKRCRGLVAAARGEVGAAEELLGEAAERSRSAGDPFHGARALLALGTVRRRARKKRTAREAIEAAAAAFEDMGAAAWAERARNELGRIGGRTRSTDLTPAERRVAELAADGRTNREIAAALFLAERTVESHLSHVYGKLGVRSRTELARRL